MTNHDPMQNSLDTLDAMIDGIAEILDGIAEQMKSAPTPRTEPIPPRNGAAAILTDRVDALERQVQTQRLQIDAILNSLTMTIEANDRLSQFIHNHQIQLADMSTRFKHELTRQAVNLIQSLGVPDDDTFEPTREDQWDYDEWKLGPNITYRTEQVPS